MEDTAAGTAKRIGRERNKKRKSPAGKGTKKRALGRMNGGDKVSILNRGRKSNGGIIKTIVTDHFKVLIRDVNNEALNEINDRKGFDNQFVVFMSVVMESDKRTGIRVNARSSNNRSAQIASNVLGNSGGIAVVRLGVDIETLTVIFVNRRFNFFKRSAEFSMQTIKQDGAKGLAQERIIKVIKVLPGGDASDSNFGNQDMNMRIPLEIAPKSMQ